MRAYKRRILNIHPALLPSFGGKGLYGQRVHEAVVRSGARFSGEPGVAHSALHTVQPLPRARAPTHPHPPPSFHAAPGPTVHFVDEEYDTGPILAQAVVPVLPTDTPQRLAARVLEQEHQLYPRGVAALVQGRVSWRADGVPVLWRAE